MTYVYPVVSRRAGGVSVGVNLSPNNACNWRCVYCQVPGLVAGKSPPIDRVQLESELRELLEAVVHGDFLARSAPEGARRLADIALSGNGEPTSSPDFEAVIEIVIRVRGELGLDVPIVVISNGSLVRNDSVQRALGALARAGGELWFKLDSATAEGLAAINGCHVSPQEHLAKLALAAELCPTWIQTCLFRRHGLPPSESELDALCRAFADAHAVGSRLRGVHLYTLARPSLQPEAPELAPLDAMTLEAFAQRVRALGLEVRVSA